jgi:signal transduction histidine kinase
MKNEQFIIIGILDLIIGFYIFLKAPKKQVNKAFLVLFLAGFGWVASLFALSNLSNFDLVLFLCKTAYISGMLVPAAMLHLIYCYPNKILNLKTVFRIYIFGVGISLLSFTNLIVGDCRIYDWGVKVLPGKLYPLSLAYFMAYIGLITFKIVKGYRSADPFQKNQWIYLIFGLPIPILHVLVTNLILPRLGFKDIYTLGPWASFEMVAFLGYAIYKYHLFNIEVILKKSVVSVCVVLVLLGIVFLINELAGALLPGNLRSNLYLTTVTVMIVTLFSLRPLNNILEKVFSGFFPPKNDEIMKLLEDTFNTNEFFKDMRGYLNQLLERIVTCLRYEKISIYLLDEKNRAYACFARSGDGCEAVPEVIERHNVLVEWILGQSAYFDRDEFEHEYGHLFLFGKKLDNLKKDVFTEAVRLKAKLVYPIMLDRSLVGIIVMGTKLNKKILNPQELSLIKVLSNQIGMAYLNYKTIQQNVSTDRIKLVGTMSASIAHEIKNPLTSIRSFSEMLTTVKNRDAVLAQFAEVVPRECDRITKIINDLLAFARSNVSEKRTCTLKVLIDEIVFLMDSDISKQGLQLDVKVAQDIVVFGDIDQIKQVLLNVFLNACQASQAGGVIAVSATQDQGEILIAIADEGHGVKKEDFDKIFEPFFSTRVCGTGLGLSTCKKIIDDHGGRILLASEEGKGSTFTVVLPVA